MAATLDIAVEQIKHSQQVARSTDSTFRPRWRRVVLPEQRNFRVFGPDETLSNGLEAVFEVTNRQWLAQTRKDDQFRATSGRVMEVLSEHQCEGWLGGYLLPG